METEIERLIVDFSSIMIDENKIIKIIKIQKWYRGCMFRLKRLPLIMYKIKHFLLSKNIVFSTQTDDGRVNSSIDEDTIITLLIQEFNQRIKKTKS